MAATDTILIRDLLVRGIIGVNDWEREKQQDILINLELAVDGRTAGASDHVKDVLNYRTLTKAIVAHVEGTQPFLVEALAHHIGSRQGAQHDIILERFRGDREFVHL